MNYFIKYDFSEKWQMLFQDPATYIMENFCDIKYYCNLLCLLIVIIVLLILKQTFIYIFKEEIIMLIRFSKKATYKKRIENTSCFANKRFMSTKTSKKEDSEKLKSSETSLKKRIFQYTGRVFEFSSRERYKTPDWVKEFNKLVPISSIRWLGFGALCYLAIFDKKIFALSTAFSLENFNTKFGSTFAIFLIVTYVFTKVLHFSFIMYYYFLSNSRIFIDWINNDIPKEEALVAFGLFSVKTGGFAVGVVGFFGGLSIIETTLHKSAHGEGSRSFFENYYSLKKTKMAVDEWMMFTKAVRLKRYLPELCENILDEKNYVREDEVIRIWKILPEKNPEAKTKIEFLEKSDK